MAARFIPLDIYILLLLKRKNLVRPLSPCERRTIHEKLTTYPLRCMVTDEFLTKPVLSMFRTPHNLTFSTDELELSGRMRKIKLPPTVAIDLATYYLLHYDFETNCVHEPTVVSNFKNYPLDAVEIGLS